MEVRCGCREGQRAWSCSGLSMGSGSEIPLLERTCHSCGTMTPQLGQRALVLSSPAEAEVVRNSIYLGMSQTMAWPWPSDSEVGSQGLGRSTLSKPRWVSPQASSEPCNELPGGQCGCVPWTQLPKGRPGVPDQPRIPPATDSESEQGHLRTVGPTWPVRTSTLETLIPLVSPPGRPSLPLGPPQMPLCTQAHEECCSPTPDTLRPCHRLSQTPAWRRDSPQSGR